jgi:peptidoglycan hydrolase FlgJ
VHTGSPDWGYPVLAAGGYRFFTGRAHACRIAKEYRMTLIPLVSTTSHSPTPLRTSAEALETAFLAEMLKNANVFRPAETFGGGAGEDHFISFMADAQARAMVARGGIGLADSIEQALRRRAGAAPQ